MSEIKVIQGDFFTEHRKKDNLILMVFFPIKSLPENIKYKHISL